ncbi:MAG: S-formylglutathione hydrolase [Proteobacteria bacterium]|nr:S-formylglutathione hydrolase [Pseudomonadota bacterium]
MKLELVKKHRIFDGSMEYYRHYSQVNQSAMSFAIFLPPQAETRKVPVLYWLSGLTCTEDNFMTKAGAQRVAAELGIAIVAMDTSPRDNGIEGEDDSYDFGSGASFYLNATIEPWSKNYNMYDYIVTELPGIIELNFNVSNKKSISGHSMGGHGALIIALRNPRSYQSVSVFSPIVAPTQNGWGCKAFSGYLGEDQSVWRQYDSCELVKIATERLPLLVDQGTADEYLDDYLQPGKLIEVCEQYNHPLNLRMQPGYDHSYFFISTFIEEHLRYHAGYL